MEELSIESKQVLNKKIGKKFITISTILLPFFACLYIISLNSNELINKTISIPILVIATALLLMLIVGIIGVVKHKNEQTPRLKRGFRVFLYIITSLYIIGSTTSMLLLYSPMSNFKNWLIPTAMTTMNHKYMATWFYDSYIVNYVMENNLVVESGEDTNPDLIPMTEPDFNPKKYANEFEKEVLSKEKGNDLYKIIDIDRPKLKGKLAVIYDPSKVKLAISKGTGNSLDSSYGQFVTQITKDNNAVIGTNAGGFYDPNWNSTGGVPHGIVISNGKLIADNAKAVGVGGIIGFNKDNKLILARMTAKQALEAGIRDAVDFGPFLIVNGESSYIKGNGGWGEAPRTAIGQRKDGIVLLLVMDGRQTSTMGADMNHLAQIMMDYGAYNAANLDGGTSSAMILNDKIITHPRNGNFQEKTRPVPNAWIVIE